MANLYKEYGTDKNLEQNGFLYVHEPATETESAQCFVLARAGGSNVRFMKVVDRLYRPHRKRGLDKMPISVQRDLMVAAFAESIVQDWEGVQDRDGSDIPFSIDNVKKVFTDLPDLFDIIQEQATELTNFLAEEVEHDVKN